jgi:tRNA ligase
VQEARTFTEEVGLSGTGNCEALEGFIVHAAVRSSSLPPYADGSSFIKVQFDEPYMMYRDRREIMRTIFCAGRERETGERKMVRPERQLYVK